MLKCAKLLDGFVRNQTQGREPTEKSLSLAQEGEKLEWDINPPCKINISYVRCTDLSKHNLQK